MKKLIVQNQALLDQAWREVESRVQLVEKQADNTKLPEFVRGLLRLVAAEAYHRISVREEEDAA